MVPVKKKLNNAFHLASLFTQILKTQKRMKSSLNLTLLYNYAWILWIL